MKDDKIHQIARAFQQSRILLTAYELNIFTIIGKGAKSSVEIAQKINADARATDRLLNALCALELLKKEHHLFYNTPTTTRFLVEGQPEFMEGLGHTVNLWKSWSTLTDAVLKGGSVLNKNLEERDDKWQTSFIAAMHDRSQVIAPEITKVVDLSKVRRILDIGGGSGAFSMAFVQAKEGITATVFDLPQIIPLTLNYIKNSGLIDKINTIPGDYRIDEFEEGYDLIFLSSIIHINSFEQNENLIRKCVQALNPNGQIVIRDFIMDEDRIHPPYGAIFALNMLVGTEGGDTYTESEVRGWLKAAGVTDISRKDTFDSATLIIGHYFGK